MRELISPLVEEEGQHVGVSVCRIIPWPHSTSSTAASAARFWIEAMQFFALDFDL